MKKTYVATVNLLFVAEDETNAVDAVSAMLSENLEFNEAILDWSYVRVGHQWLYPTSANFRRSLDDGSTEL